MLLYDALVNFISPADLVSGEVVVAVAYYALILWTALWILYALSFRRWIWQKLATVLVHVVALSVLLVVADVRALSSQMLLFAIAWYCLAVLTLAVVALLTLAVLSYRNVRSIPKAERVAAWVVIAKTWSQSHWSATVLRTAAIYTYLIIAFAVGSIAFYRLLLEFGSGLVVTVLLASCYLVYLGARVVFDPMAARLVSKVRQLIVNRHHAS